MWKTCVFYTLSEKSNISIGEIDADLSKFDDAELEWLASKVFGFNGYLYDTTSLFSKVVENISAVTFMEDGKSVFEKDTEKKLKRKE